MTNLLPSSNDSRVEVLRALGVGKRMLRRWWLIVGLGIVGTGLAIGFGYLRGHNYQSEVVLMYRELIPTKLLQGSDAGDGARNMESRLRDVANSTKVLTGLLDRRGLLREMREDEGVAAALEELKRRIQLRSMGGGSFRISYAGRSPSEAQRVADDLARALIAEEQSFRESGTRATERFLRAELEEAEEALHGRELAMAEFLTRHPEFAGDSSGPASWPGASIRARATSEVEASDGDDTLSALRRRKRNLAARISTSASNAEALDTPLLVSATRRRDIAREEYRGVEREVAALEVKYQPRHPDLVAARYRMGALKKRYNRANEHVAAAERVRRAAAAPAIGAEREAIEDELEKVTEAIGSYRRESRVTPIDKALEQSLVKLETEWSRHQRLVEESRDRLDSITTKSFTAEMLAASEAGAGSSQLVVLDPATQPVRPSGVPRKLIAMVGFIAFAGVGMAFALLLAVLDDSIFAATDLERYGLDTSFVEIPPTKRRSLFRA